MTSIEISIPQLVLLVAVGSAIGGGVVFFIFVTLLRAVTPSRLRDGHACSICFLVYERTVYIPTSTDIGKDQ